MHSKPALFFVFLAISLAQGCSFSHSSDSSANSSKSSGSSSSTSPSSEDTETYQLQVINYTVAYYSTAEFEHFAFTRGISEIANENGVTDWEDDKITLIAIGRGLKSSNINSHLYETYKKSLAGSKASRMQWIQKGYDMQ